MTQRYLFALSPALLFISACGVVGEIGGGLTEDPALEQDQPQVEYVNPSAFSYSTFVSPPCHTVMASWDGVDAYSNGPSSGTGYSCGGGGTYGLQYQCVELVMRYFKIKYGLRWHGNAKDLLNNAPRAQVDVYSNGDAAHPPVPGDMIVWPNSTYGHVALVTKVSPSSVTIMEQNTKGSATATLPFDPSTGRVGTRWGSWTPTGWAHAKANGNNPPPSNPPPSNPPPSTPPPSTPPPSTPPPSNGCHIGSIYGLVYCSAGCPCDEGEGDCDSDDQCKTGLICAKDVGTDHGAPWYIDVCRKPAPPSNPPPSNPPPSTPPPAQGNTSATCAGCNLSTHDCTRYQGVYNCIPKSSSCPYTDGTLFRQCNCTGWSFCLPSGVWASCATSPGIFSCQ